MGVVHEDEREGALQLREHLHERALEIATVAALALAAGADGVLQQLGHDVAVAGDRAGEHARIAHQLGGVDQVAVVTEGEARVTRLAVDGLRVAPGARAARRVARVADGEVSFERCHVALVEDVGDEAHVLQDIDVLAVAHRHAGRLLAPMLQRVETGIGEMSDRLVGRIHAEHPTRFASVHDFILAHGNPIPRQGATATRSGSGRSNCVRQRVAPCARRVGERDVDETLDHQAVAMGATDLGHRDAGRDRP